MKKYEVRVEILVYSVDLATYEVEASSPDEAKQLAAKQFESGKSPTSIWASDSTDTKVDTDSMPDWIVEGIT